MLDPCLNSPEKNHYLSAHWYVAPHISNIVAKGQYEEFNIMWLLSLSTYISLSVQLDIRCVMLMTMAWGEDQFFWTMWTALGMKRGWLIVNTMKFLFIIVIIITMQESTVLQEVLYLTTHTSYGFLCFKLRFALAFLGYWIVDWIYVSVDCLSTHTSMTTHIIQWTTMNKINKE